MANTKNGEYLAELRAACGTSRRATRSAASAGEDNVSQYASAAEAKAARAATAAKDAEYLAELRAACGTSSLKTGTATSGGLGKSSAATAVYVPPTLPQPDPVAQSLRAQNEAKQKAIYGDTDLSSFTYQTTAEYDDEITKLQKQMDEAAPETALSNLWNKVVATKSGGQKELREQIDRLSAERNLLERATAIKNKYGGLSQSDDFSANSGVTRHDDDQAYIAVNEGVYRDLFPKTYEGEYGWVDGQWVTDKNAATLAKKYGWDARETKNRIAAAVVGQQDASQDDEDVYLKSTYGELDWLTDEERATYNYLYNTVGAEKAGEYLDDMKPILQRRHTVNDEWEDAETYENASDLEKGLMNAATLVTSPIGNVVAAVNDVAEAVTGEYSPYGTAHQLVNYTDTIRSLTGQEISDEVLLAGGSETLAQAASVAYQSVMSAGDAALGGLTLGPGYLAVAAAGSATRKARELYEQGADGGQILLGSVAAGAIEAVMEKVPLDKLLDMAGGTSGLKAFFLNIVKQAGTEGGEEALTEIANLAADSVIRGGTSDLAMLIAEYEAQGYSHSQAQQMAARDTTMDVLWAAVGGAVSGGSGAAVYSTAGLVKERTELTRLGKVYMQDETTLHSAIAVGLDNARTTEAYKAASEMASAITQGKAESITPYQVGKMLRDSQTQEAQTARALDHAVRESAAQYGVAEDVADTVANIAAGAGRQIVFGTFTENENGNTIAGQYDPETGSITINAAATADQAMEFVVKHELSHSVEGTKQWEQLADIAQAQMGDEKWSANLAQVMETYGAQDDSFDLKKAEREVVANWIGDNLYRSGFANAIVKGSATVGNAFMRTLDKLRLAIGTKKSRSHTNLAVVERLFMRALESEGGGDGGKAKYSIGYTTSNRPVVVINEDILAGVPYDQYVTVAEDIIKNRFSNGVPISGRLIKINKLTRDEYTHSRNTRHYKAKDGTIYADKMRAAGKLDEIVLASTNYVNEDLNHSRKDKIIQFARGDVLMRVNGNDYSAKVIIGLTSGNSMLLYDVIDFTPTSFHLKPKKEADMSSPSTQNNAKNSSNISASNTNVSQNSLGVNSQFMQGGEEYAPYSFGREEGNPSTAERRSPSLYTREAGATPNAAAAIGASRSPVAYAPLNTADAVFPSEREAGAALEAAQDVESAIDVLGDAEAWRRLYRAATINRPTGTVEGMSADEYMEREYHRLPEDEAAIRAAMEETTAAYKDELYRLEMAGETDSETRLKLNLQLFAQKARLDYMLDEGENGKKARRFYEQRLKGQDANHSEELLALLKERDETYNPIANEKTLAAAKEQLRDEVYREQLTRRLMRYNKKDMLSHVDAAAAQVMINDAINNGEAEKAADMIHGLSRKGTELGRAVQILSMQARLTPEGTLRAAQRAMRQATDRRYGDGTSGAIDDLSADIADAIERVGATLSTKAKTGSQSQAQGQHVPMRGTTPGQGDSIPSPEELVKTAADMEREAGYLSRDEIKAIQRVTGGVRASFFDLSDAQVQTLAPLEKRLLRELGEKSPFFRRRFGEWRARETTPVEIVREKDSGRGVQRNADTGWDIQVSGKVFDESKSHISTQAKSARAYMPYINDIVRKAVLLNTFTLDKAKSENSLCMHALYALADIGQGPTLLKLYVEEMYNPGQKNNARRVYQLLNIESHPAGVRSSQQNAASSNNTLPGGNADPAGVKGSQQNAASLITLPGGKASIADLVALVKEKDTSYAPKDTASREALVEGLVDDLAGEQSPYITREEIQAIVERAVESATSLPAQLKKLLRDPEKKALLAEKIATVYEAGHLNDGTLRRAFCEALGLPGLSEGDLKTLVDMVTAMQTTDEGTPAYYEAAESIYRFLGERLPVSRLETLTAWRKLAMLANPKTHIRNYVSNGGMYYGIHQADKAFATALQGWLMKDAATRTAMLGWSHTESGRRLLADEAIQKAADEAVARMRGTGGKYDISAGTLGRYRKMFGSSKVGEVLNKANDVNSEWLEKGDAFFFRRAYIDALGQAMVARGVSAVTPELDALATARAEEVTFRAENAINDVLTSLKRHMGGNHKGMQALGLLTDIVIPFTKTPANIATQTIQHSPIGLAKSTYDLAMALRERARAGEGKGQEAVARDMADAINGVAKGLTGTVLTAMGLLLGSLGLFTTGWGKTEKERAADELAGVQENALQIGGWSVTLDWLQPAAAPLIVGASIAQRLREDGLSLGAVFGAVMDGTDSLFELSMLQSLYDVLGGYDAGATATAASVLENVVSQSIPTVVGQAARVIDPVARKTTGDSDAETIINQVLAKIPGLTYLLDPQLDVWGNEVYRTGKADGLGAVINAFQQVLSPANIKRATGDDAISQMLLALYDSDIERSSRAIPSEPDRDMAAELGMELPALQRLAGRANRQAVEDLVADKVRYTVQETTAGGRTRNVAKRWSDMTDKERARVLNRIYTNTKQQIEEPEDDYFTTLLKEAQYGN